MGFNRARDLPVQDQTMEQMMQVVGQPIEKVDKNRKKRKINKPAKKMKGKKMKAK